MVEYDVDPSLLCPGPSLLVSFFVGPGQVGSEAHALFAFVCRRSGHSNLCSVELCDLDGVHTDAGGARLNQNLVSGLDSSATHQHVPSRQEAEGSTRRLFRRDRTRQQVRLRNHDALAHSAVHSLATNGVVAAQRVAITSAFRTALTAIPGLQRDHFARIFTNTDHIGAGNQWKRKSVRVHTTSDPHIEVVQAHMGDPHAHLTGAHNGVVDLDDARQLPVNTGITLVAGSQSGLGRLRDDKRVHRIPDRSVFDVRPRSREQHIALDLLTDDSVGIVSLGGRAGTGKSVLALAAALEAVLEQRTHSKVIVFRPLYAVGGQDLGYLPGSEAEKMSPWAAAVGDALEAIAGPEVVDEVMHRELLEILPLTHIRGRSITDAFIIVDEAQNLERNVLLTALTRIGENSKVVLTHDVAQRDNLRVGRFDGIGAVVDHLRGHPLFGHITLTRSERSPVAALVAGLLDGHG